MALNIDDFLTKAADAFEKNAEKHYKDAEQAEGLADLMTDPEIRDLVGDLVLSGGLLIGALGAKLKDIFAEDEEPAPAPEPEPAPAPTVTDPFDLLLGDVNESAQERLARIIEGLNISNRGGSLF